MSRIDDILRKQGICPDCSVSAIGDPSCATVGATGTVKRISRRRWVWHVHSLKTDYNSGEGYSARGVVKSKAEALDMVEALINLAAVAWEAGERYGAAWCRRQIKPVTQQEGEPNAEIPCGLLPRVRNAHPRLDDVSPSSALRDLGGVPRRP